MNFSLSLSHQQIKKKKKGSRRSRGGGLLTSSRSLLGWLLLRRPFLTLRLKLCPSACSPALSSLTACTPVWCGVDLSLLRLLTLSTCPWSTGLRVARVCLAHLSKPPSEQAPGLGPVVCDKRATPAWCGGSMVRTAVLDFKDHRDPGRHSQTPKHPAL